MIEELPLWEMKLIQNDLKYFYTLERKQNKMSKHDMIYMNIITLTRFRALV